ncbi:TetR/AcrR family transcriptional regulator [Corynebacterium sp. 335C]
MTDHPAAPATKGERTRARILDAATGLFAERSFGAVPVRAIAAAAGVDPALVNHYFGSKEGLFRAVLEGISRPGDMVAQLAALPPEDRGHAIVAHAESVWSGPGGPALLAVARRAFADEPELLRTVVGGAILDRVVTLLDGPDDERRLRAALAGSQLAGLFVARHMVRIPALADLPGDRIADLVGPAVQRHLTGPLADGGPGVG